MAAATVRGKALLLLATIAGLLPSAGIAASACVDTYTQVFKVRKGAKVAPSEVGALYTTWCKKNMKVSSAKSMDELCAPLARKVEEKMMWVPPATDVTPEIACEGADKLKERFPEHVKVAEAQLKDTGAQEARKKQLLEKAKALKGQLDGVVRESVTTWGKSLVDDLGAKIRAKTLEVLGPDSAEAPREALAKHLQDAAGLNSRGAETKLLQKLEEAIGSWAREAAKETAKEAKASEL